MKVRIDGAAETPKVETLYDQLDKAKPGEYCQHKNRDYYQEVEKGKDGQRGRCEDVCIRCSQELTAKLNGGVVVARREEKSKSETQEEHTMKAKVDGKTATKEAPAKKESPAKKKAVKASKGERTGTPRAVGKRLKLGINATWVHLFQENEKLAKAGKPKTDEQITEFMYSEFAPRKSKVFAHVSSVRSRYNNGLLTQGEKPRIQSSPYNKRATDKKSK